MPQDVQQPDSGINIGGVNGGLTVGGDIVGRDKHISIEHLTIQQFTEGAGSLQDQLEFFLKHIGLENVQARYTTSRFEAYCGAWQRLQALRLAGEDLWDVATNENIAKFSTELRETQLVVRQGEIFFDEEDRVRLLQLLDTFGQFRLGKLRLIEIDSQKMAEDYQVEHFAREQIQINRQYKEEYERLLDKIRVCFKVRLSTPAA